MIAPGEGRRIAIALSGGIDSLCAMLLLKDAGYDVFALHGRFITKEDLYLQSLKDICSSLSVKLHIIDLRQSFAEKLLRPFAQAWVDGQTPNPCSLCNREIKFGILKEYAYKLGANFFATGHYAHSFLHPSYGTQVLGPAQDLRKDQSYFLSLVPAKNLIDLLFPLSSLTKEECRQIVANAGFIPPVVKESQDICFLDSGESHADFVEKWAQNRFLPKDSIGPIYILEKDKHGKEYKKILGMHKGLWHYTIGQRKGLGIPYSEALYVMSRDKANGSLLLAPRSAMLIKNCSVGNLNFFVPQEKWPDIIFSKLRYKQKPAQIRASIENNKIFLEFKEPLFPGAEGQVATVEDEEGVILAAGLIENMDFGN